MSIRNQKNPFFYHRLMDAISFYIFIFFLYTSLSLIPQFTLIAKADCYAVSGGCSVLGNKYYLLEDHSQCILDGASKGYLPHNTICCCTRDITEPLKPKYLLIGSIVAFFAIITTLALFNKKNE
jgi:hypothetical protein